MVTLAALHIGWLKLRVVFLFKNDRGKKFSNNVIYNYSNKEVP